MNGKTISDAIAKFIEWAIMNPFRFCIWVTAAVIAVALITNALPLVGLHVIAPISSVQNLAWFAAACYFAKLAL